MQNRLVRARIVALAFASLTSASALADCDPGDAAIEGAARFEINGDLAYDKTTDLNWQRCSVGQRLDPSGTCVGTTSKFTFEDAQTVGTDGWRTPTLEEYGTIVASYCRDPAVDLTVFPGTISENYWSSIFTNPMTWYFSTRGGSPNPTYYTSMKYAVRLVKTGR
jgi:hypothetical protein